MIGFGKFANIGEEVAVACFKALSQHSSGGTEEAHSKLVNWVCIA
jgi:hypothetical protein